jgi:hypothetical protein
MKGSDFRVFRVQSLGFGIVRSLKYKVHGLGFKDYGLGLF